MTVSGIDINVLMDAACGNREIAADLMKLFFKLTGGEQANLADAVARKDHAAISAIAHKVAGSCIACGMGGLSAQFKELENLCKNSLPEDTGARIQAVDRQLQDVRRYLEEFFTCPLAP